MKYYLSTLLVVLLLCCSGKGNDETVPSPPSVGNSPALTSVAVPGTSVRLPPPEGFMPADRFPGFMKESTGSSIMVSEIPGPYGEVTAGFSNKK